MLIKFPFAAVLGLRSLKIGTAKAAPTYGCATTTIYRSSHKVTKTVKRYASVDGALNAAHRIEAYNLGYRD